MARSLSFRQTCPSIRTSRTNRTSDLGVSQSVARSSAAMWSTCLAAHNRPIDRQTVWWANSDGHTWRVRARRLADRVSAMNEKEAEYKAAFVMRRFPRRSECAGRKEQGMVVPHRRSDPRAWVTPQSAGPEQGTPRCCSSVPCISHPVELSLLISRKQVSVNL